MNNNVIESIYSLKNKTFDQVSLEIKDILMENSFSQSDTERMKNQSIEDLVSTLLLILLSSGDYLISKEMYTFKVVTSEKNEYFEEGYNICLNLEIKSGIFNVTICDHDGWYGFVHSFNINLSEWTVSGSRHEVHSLPEPGGSGNYTYPKEGWNQQFCFENFVRKKLEFIFSKKEILQKI